MCPDDTIEKTSSETKTAMTVQEQTIEYWNSRSKGYSIATRAELEHEPNVLKTIMHNQIGVNRKFRVADMGTGAGWAAITMAKLGHDVVAVDNSENMLEHARANALDAGVDIEFILGDVTDPPLERNDFDIVVSKNIVWNLMDPTTAYYSWINLLKPGGILIVIDGNWYLDEFDDDFKKRSKFIEMKYGTDNNLHAHTNVDKVDLSIIRKLSCNYPASMERRPTWDVGILLGLGVTDIRIQSLDREPFSVLTRDGIMKIPLSFSLIARIPGQSSSPYDDATRSACSEDDLEAITKSLSSMNPGYERIMKTLSDPNRISIVLALMSGKMSVRQLASVTNESVSLASHNLKILRESKIVSSERDGKEIRYFLTDRIAVSNILETCASILMN